MDSLRKQWVLISSYIEERQLSERVLMFCAASAVMVALLNAVLLDPLFARSNALHTTILQERSQISALADQTHTLLEAMREPTDTAADVHRRTLDAELSKVTASLAELLQHQVPAQRMATLLEDMLQQNHRVQLVAFRTLPVTLFNTSVEHADKTNDAQEPAIYQHGVELTVEGSYSDLLGYLDALEHLPWQLFFGDLTFVVKEYPQERVTLVLYTLCSDRTWLSL